MNKFFLICLLKCINSLYETHFQWVLNFYIWFISLLLSFRWTFKYYATCKKVSCPHSCLFPLLFYFTPFVISRWVCMYQVIANVLPILKYCAPKSRASMIYWLYVAFRPVRECFTHRGSCHCQSNLGLNSISIILPLSTHYFKL